ncbi:MAG: VanZ family protein [Anaerolineae bacterium]|nr:VanZ family protein [Anaerolineae bacterium]
MKTRFGFVPLRLIVLVAWGLLAIILTTQSDRLPLVHLMTSTIGSTDLGDALGHAGLFGVLTFAVYMVMAIRLKREWALPLAMFVVLSLGGLTELSQFGVLNRAPSVSDLLANSLGVFVVGFAMSYLSILRSRYAL